MTRRWRGFRRHDEPEPVPVPVAAARPGTGVHTLTMAVAPTTVRLAARTTRTVLTARGVPAGAAVLDAALLIVTELAANTVRHTRSSRARPAVLVAEDHFTIAVRDDDRPRPRPAPAHTPRSTDELGQQ
ncbi:ATP-binding protein [Kitasatospora purpeofusca]|uniref:Histidine kinase/HSP90-like ATPase domain-containing protein n=1 Tax=Kitasatospora purpeofusca TaxID=67352 RepID=A0ABZ1UBG6_9ACTN|nr:ATP-binding protein [Kitasatospora purpeofusca]